MTDFESKYVVCPDCRGEGSFGPGWVWTQDEVAQEDPDEFADMQRRLRAGEFNVPCGFCKGQRVVTREQEEGWEAEMEMRAMERAERAFGC